MHICQTCMFDESERSPELTEDTPAQPLTVKQNVSHLCTGKASTAKTCTHLTARPCTSADPALSALPRCSPPTHEQSATGMCRSSAPSIMPADSGDNNLAGAKARGRRCSKTSAATRNSTYALVHLSPRHIKGSRQHAARGKRGAVAARPRPRRALTRTPTGSRGAPPPPPLA